MLAKCRSKKRAFRSSYCACGQWGSNDSNMGSCQKTATFMFFFLLWFSGGYSSFGQTHGIFWIDPVRLISWTKVTIASSRWELLDADVFSVKRDLGQIAVAIDP